MSRQVLSIVGVGALVLILQRAVMNNFTVLGVHADVLLLFALCIAITGGSRRGALAGFLAGLIADVYLTSPLGLAALAYAVAGYIVGSMSDDTSELAWVTAVLAGLGSAMGVVVFVVFGHLLGEVSVGVWRTFTIGFVVASINMVCAPFLAPILRRASVKREAVW